MLEDAACAVLAWLMQLYQTCWPIFLFMSSLKRKDQPEEACLAFQLQVEFVRDFPLDYVGVGCKGYFGSQLGYTSCRGNIVLGSEGDVAQWQDLLAGGFLLPVRGKTAG